MIIGSQFILSKCSVRCALCCLILSGNVYTLFVKPVICFCISYVNLDIRPYTRLQGAADKCLTQKSSSDFQQELNFLYKNFIFEVTFEHTCTDSPVRHLFKRYIQDNLPLSIVQFWRLFKRYLFGLLFLIYVLVKKGLILLCPQQNVNLAHCQQTNEWKLKNLDLGVPLLLLSLCLKTRQQ